MQKFIERREITRKTEEERNKEIMDKFEAKLYGNGDMPLVTERVLGIAVEPQPEDIINSDQCAELYRDSLKECNFQQYAKKLRAH